MSTFVTKDSGKRETFESGMQRDSGEKDLRPDLIWGPLLIRWAELMGRGAKKYGERNWELACTERELHRARESLFRHFVQYFYSLDTSEDHAAAIIFNLAECEYIKERLAPRKSAVSSFAVGQRVRVIDPGHDLYGHAGLITVIEEIADPELKVDFPEQGARWFWLAQIEIVSGAV